MTTRLFSISFCLYVDVSLSITLFRFYDSFLSFLLCAKRVFYGLFDAYDLNIVLIAAL